MLRDSIKHPSFRLGLLAIVLLIGSISNGVKNYNAPYLLFFFAVLLTVIDWILTLQLITRNPFLDIGAKWFWIVTATLLPPIGGMIYIMMENRKIGL